MFNAPLYNSLVVNVFHSQVKSNGIMSMRMIIPDVIQDIQDELNVSIYLRTEQNQREKAAS